MSVKSASEVGIENSVYTNDLTVNLTLEGKSLNKLNASDIMAKVTYKTSNESSTIKANGTNCEVTTVSDKAVSGNKFSHTFKVSNLTSESQSGTNAVFSFVINTKDMNVNDFPNEFLIELSGESESAIGHTFGYSEYFKFAQRSDDSDSGEQGGNQSGDEQVSVETGKDGNTGLDIITFSMGEGIKIDFIKPEGKDYYIGATEVTQAQYFRIMRTNPSTFNGSSSADVAPTTTADYPVDSVKYNYLVSTEHPEDSFIGKINTLFAEQLAQQNLTFAIPTAEQWEYACGAGNDLSEANYGKGENDAEITDDNIGEYAVYNCESSTSVKSKKANAWGFYDMYGNVAEWTSTTVGGRNYRGGSYKLTSTYSLKTKNQQSWTSPDGQPGNNYNVGVFGFRLALVPVAE